MRFQPLNAAAAVSGLVGTADRALSQIDAGLDDEHLRGSARDGLQRVRDTFRRLENVVVVSEDGEKEAIELIPEEGRVLLQVRHLVALLGEGVLTLERFVELLDVPITKKRDGELSGILPVLGDFSLVVNLLIGVLQGSTTSNQDDIDAVISALLRRGGRITRRLGHCLPSNITLSSISSLAHIYIPISAKDMPSSAAHYSFDAHDEDDSDFDSDSDADSSPATPTSTASSPSPTPHHNTNAPSGGNPSLATLIASQPQNSPGTSCTTIFCLPGITHEMILQLFQHAGLVSHRFGKAFRRHIHATAHKKSLSASSSKPKSNDPPEEEGGIKTTKEESSRGLDKIRSLTPLQFRELSIDVYDELVRKNVWDRRRLDTRNYRTTADAEPAVVGDASFSWRREHARARLAGIGDDAFFVLFLDVFGELERRRMREEEVPAGELARDNDGRGGGW